MEQLTPGQEAAIAWHQKFTERRVLVANLPALVQQLFFLEPFIDFMVLIEEIRQGKMEEVLSVDPVTEAGKVARLQGAASILGELGSVVIDAIKDEADERSVRHS